MNNLWTWELLCVHLYVTNQNDFLTDLNDTGIWPCMPVVMSCSKITLICWKMHSIWRLSRCKRANSCLRNAKSIFWVNIRFTFWTRCLFHSRYNLSFLWRRIRLQQGLCVYFCWRYHMCESFVSTYLKWSIVFVRCCIFK